MTKAGILLILGQPHTSHFLCDAINDPWKRVKAENNDIGVGLARLLKNAHLRRCPHPSSLRRTFKFASLLRMSGAFHPGIFDQPAKNEFFNRLLQYKTEKKLY